MVKMDLSNFVKEKRKLVNLTQPELAVKAGVGLRFVRELEQGKTTLRMDKVNQVLQLFGCELGAVPFTKENYKWDIYRGSYEQIAKTIQKYSTTSGLDLVNLFEVVLFSFLTGNADMHLKNFSLLEHPGLGMRLAPAYDLVNTKLVNPADDEELALNLNGKKRRLKKQDFVAAMDTVNLDPKQQENIFNKMEKAKPTWFECIDHSFLRDDFKERYKTIITERFEKLH